MRERPLTCYPRRCRSCSCHCCSRRSRRAADVPTSDSVVHQRAAERRCPFRRWSSTQGAKTWSRSRTTASERPTVQSAEESPPRVAINVRPRPGSRSSPGPVALRHGRGKNRGAGVLLVRPSGEEGVDWGGEGEGTENGGCDVGEGACAEGIGEVEGFRWRDDRSLAVARRRAGVALLDSFFL